MIYLERNKVNSVVLTLSESSRISNPSYLFRFQSQFTETSDPIYFTTPDISDFTCRFNLFEITESASGSTSGGTDVSLSLIPGQYEYKVYESSASTTSLSATTGSVIEVGIMIVGGEDNNTINNGPIDPRYI